jgi:hypothetical protein
VLREGLWSRFHGSIKSWLRPVSDRWHFGFSTCRNTYQGRQQLVSDFGLGSSNKAKARVLGTTNNICFTTVNEFRIFCLCLWQDSSLISISLESIFFIKQSILHLNDTQKVLVIELSNTQCNSFCVPKMSSSKSTAIPTHKAEKNYKNNNHRWTSAFILYFMMAALWQFI